VIESIETAVLNKFRYAKPYLSSYPRVYGKRDAMVLKCGLDPSAGVGF
jgi:hypothetical protein